MKKVVVESLNVPGSIRSSSGLYVSIDNIDPYSINIEDIAHASASQPRFGGHLPFSPEGYVYSVAQHCINCFMMAPPEYELEALMHDASEAYLCDIPSPFKARMADYVNLESRLMHVIADKFKFKYPVPPEIKKIDRLVLEREWNVIMLNKPGIQYDPIRIMSAPEAKARFLEIFEQIDRR